MYVSWNFGLLGLQKNFSPLGKTFAFVSTMNLTGSVTPVTTKSTAIVTNKRVSEKTSLAVFFFSHTFYSLQLVLLAIWVSQTSLK